MKISTKGRYALRVMVDLAANNTGEFIPLKDIAERQDITIKYMEQLISSLLKVGYIKSLRGNKGGYKLTKEPKEYTVGNILRTMEGSLAPISCLEDLTNQCPRNDKCLTLPFWEGLYQVINHYVDSVTLEDLLRNQSVPCSD